MPINSLYLPLTTLSKKIFCSAAFLATVAISASLQTSASAQEPPSADERLTKLAEPAVVQIVDGCYGTYRFYDPTVGGSVATNGLPITVSNVSIGSGFLIHSSGYIVTNAHVVSETNDDYKICEEELFKMFVTELEQIAGVKSGAYLNNEGSMQFLKNNSPLDGGAVGRVHEVWLPNRKNEEDLNFSIRSFGNTISDGAQIQGKDVAIIKVELEDAPTLALADSKLPSDASKVLVLGYPAEADFDFFDSKSLTQMSTIPGTVSSIKKTKDGVNVIQISASVSAGISGGPVINNEGKVIGIIAFGNQSDSGTTSIPNAIPISTVNEFIGAADGIRSQLNEPNETNDLYKKGLEQYWAGDYAKAKINLERVQGLFEDHSEIDDLIKATNRAIAIDNPTVLGESSGFPFFNKTLQMALLGIGGVAGAAVIGAVIGKWYFRKPESPRSPPSPPQPINDPTRVHSPRSSTAFANRANTDPLSNGSVPVSNSWLELEYKGEIERLYLSKEQHKLGRDTSWADLKVPNGWGVVSGRHARLQKEGINYRIFDGDEQGRVSSNGLKFKDTESVDARGGYLLTHGTQLKIGSISGDKVTITFFNPASVRPTYDPTEVAQ